MYYLLMENFSNYKNRICNKRNTVIEYIDIMELNHYRFLENSTINTNFNTRDGIIMEHDFPLQYPEESDLNPDYLIVYKYDGSDKEIVSRWFVIKRRLKSGHQYNLILKRDVVADYKELVMTAPAFIEKGMTTSGSFCIYNHENMTFNQIKKADISIKDASNSAWIVGYLANDHTALTNETFAYNEDYDMVISGNIENWAYYDLCSGTEMTSVDVWKSTWEFVLKPDVFSNSGIFTWNKDSQTVTYGYWTNDHWWTPSLPSYEVLEQMSWSSFYSLSDINDYVQSANPSFVSYSRYNTFKNNYVGKRIKFDNGIYTITVNENSALDTDWILEPTDSSLYTYVYNRTIALMTFAYGTNYISGTWNHPFHYKLYRNKFTASAEIISPPGTYTYSIPTSVNDLNDAPYKMFAIPYYTGENTFELKINSNTPFEANKELMLKWAYDIIQKMGGVGQSGSHAYDLQLLPYCPISNFSGITPGDGVVVTNKTENYDFIYLKDSNSNNVGACFFCESSSKEFILTDSKYTHEVSDYKIENETQFWRVCSPNYASVFEFSPAKNRGVIYWNIRYTYKPYIPFIQVYPFFSGLYQSNYKDNRGLIVSGDFSLSVVSDPWTNYQLNNKNYLLAFDRQIENLEITQSVQRVNEVFGALAGSVKGGVMGGITGGMATGGNPAGAVAGAVMGTVTSLAGGILDFTNNERLRKETIDYTKDQFGYSLQNIQALPNTLNKVTSIVANSKLFPFIEKYDCSDEERTALINKLKYNSMTIMKVGKIEDFLQRNPYENKLIYVKAKLIRLEEMGTNADIAEALSEELDKGVYFKV